MITDKGKSLIASYLVSTFNESNVGSGGNASSPSQTELDVPLLSSNVSAVGVKSAENTVQWKITVQGSESSITGRTLREISLEDSSGNLLLRIPFDAIGPFSTSEEVEFFIEVEVE